MQMNQTITLGYIPTRRSNFSVAEAIRYKKLIRQRLEGLDVRLVDLEDVNPEGLLLREEDVPRVIAKMREHRVDAIMIALCNFGCEGAVAQVAQALKVPTLLYGPRDEGPDDDGMRQRDTQCGLFALGKVLRLHNVTFTYITNVAPDDRVLLDGLDKFMRVVNVVKTFANIRVLQIGPRPEEFLSVMANEEELRQRFGIKVFPVSLLDLKHQMEDFCTQEPGLVAAQCDDMYKRYIGEGMENPAVVEKLAAMKLAIRRLAQRYDCNCGCIQCWPAMQREMDVFPCAANSMLADEGFPVACETDIKGAISALMIQAATGHAQPHFLADLTIRHPEKENVELLWHCGAFPSAFAKDPADCKITRAWDGGPCSGNCAWELKPGDITLCRFDDDNGQYSLFLGEGRGVEGPLCKGTYVWFEVNDWPAWEHHLVQGPYIHHVAGTYGHVADVLMEACRYIPHLQADPVSPTRGELACRYIH